MKPRIVRWQIGDWRAADVPEPDRGAVLHALGVFWARPSDGGRCRPLVQGSVADRTLATLAELHPSLALSFEDVSGEYIFGTTRAPADYDGFGTIGLGPVDEDSIPLGLRRATPRLVAIRHDALTWQTTRYHSGLGGWEPDPS